MRIATTYDNGEIFQHFGKTEFFKLYEIENNEIASSDVISSNGSGHGALAGILAEHSVDVIICGGIGGGAQNALAEHGIEVCAGATGNTDDAVIAYLNGELVSSGVNCHHHDHEEGHRCGEHGCDSHGCGSHGCGGHDDENLCGGCATPTFTVTGPNAGKTCRVHYKGTFNDGTQFDSSYDRGETLEFTCGVGMMIKGFDSAVANMKVGQTITIHLMPEEAYGDIDPNAFVTFKVSDLPGSEELEVNDQAYLYNSYGQPVRATVTSKDETSITFDTNHEMAGKELNFQIELVEVE